MPPAQPPAQQSSENSLDFVWMIVLAMAAVFLIWYFGKSYIGAGVYFVRYYEIVTIKFFLTIWNRIATLVNLPLANLTNLNAMQVTASTYSKTAVTFKSLLNISAGVGKYLRYPAVLVLLILAYRIFFGSISSHFRTVFSMKKFREIEHENWPRISPIIKHNLVAEDIDKGDWAMALTPLQFCKKYNLVTEEKKQNQTVLSLLKGEAYKVFALQLGPLWNGNVNSLPAHVKLLLGIFAARVEGEMDLADDVLDKVALSSINGKPDLYGYDDLLKYLNSKPTMKRLGQHAYVSTMLSSMLDLARGSGVLATADFLWLKPLDRRLWYVLNCVGRQTAFCEAAGIFSHWLVERKVGYPFKVPMVDSAVNALDEALQDILYEPEL
jgi:intracellular multiplication protein IcmP